MRGRNRLGGIGALLGLRANLNSSVRGSSVLCHMPQAMMRSVPSAAGRRIRLNVGRQGEERRHERQTEKGQQQNGKKLTHWLHWNLKLRCLQQQLAIRPFQETPGRRKYT
jgi:hypothetical protein